MDVFDNLRWLAEDSILSKNCLSHRTGIYQGEYLENAQWSTRRLGS